MLSKLLKLHSSTSRSKQPKAPTSTRNQVTLEDIDLRPVILISSRLKECEKTKRVRVD